MMKNHRVILFSLVVVMNIACANAITTKDTDIRSGSGTEAKYQIAQNNKSDEEDIMHFSKGILGGITRFEKVPDDEERLIEHRPIGGINRARVEIYRVLSEFRHKQNNTRLTEPQKDEQ